jgi:hypothetical protein
MSAAAGQPGGIDILVSNGLGVVGEHIQAPSVEDLVQLLSSLLVAGPREPGHHLWSCGLIGEVGLFRRSPRRGGRDAAGDLDAGCRAQPEAWTDKGCHCALRGLDSRSREGALSS